MTIYYLAVTKGNKIICERYPLHCVSLQHAKQSASIIYKGADLDFTLILSKEENYSGIVERLCYKKNVIGKRWINY